MGLVGRLAAMAVCTNEQRNRKQRDLDRSWSAHWARWSSERHNVESRGRISHIYGVRLVPLIAPPASSEQALRADQTTRIHAAVPESKGDDEKFTSSWHEVGRPQVHGYDLLGVVSLDPLRFVSIADEKVARVFGAPRSFVRTLRGLGVVDLEVDEVKPAVPSE